MPFTIAEKILARAAGQAGLTAGDDIQVKPDFVHAYDFPGYTDVIFKTMKEEFGIDQIPEPERYAIFIDHMVPAIDPKEELLHAGTREWCADNNVALFERKGIGHQVASEVGYAVPGSFLVHFDGHISQMGAFGMLAVGLRRHLLEAFVRETITFQVPATTRVNLTGKLQPGVMARDVFHHVVRTIGPRSCNFQVLEFGGDGMMNFTIADRQTLCGLAMFTGAITAIVNPDEMTLAYTGPLACLELDPVCSDDDAEFAAVHDIDISELAPIVVVPPNPSNTEDLTDHLGLEVHTGYLGSCASGRLEDLRAAAQVLKGRKIKEGFALHVIPTSNVIMARAAEEGLITILADAGAFISSSSCDYCFGRIATMSAGQRAVSTGTLNVRGRMGSPDSEIYICNAAAVAAAALEGKIADPRDYFDGPGDTQ